MNWDQRAAKVRMPNHARDFLSVADIEDVESRFSGWLVCGHARCGEVVAVSGVVSHRYDYDDCGKTVVRERLHPVAMHPPPPVIGIADEVPETIQKVLSASFGLFWLNQEACAGRLRLVVELVLDKQGVPRETRDGTFVPLHKRIENWRSSENGAAFADSLMAIKWLGNVGVHEDDVSRDRLLVAYELLDRALKRLFPSDEGYLDELADEMVRSKGRGRLKDGPLGSSDRATHR